MANFPLITQRVEQNNQEFLLGVFTIEQVLKFTRYTKYTILGFDEENEFKPRTNREVQRKLSASKINSIVSFLLNDPLAIFPTNLVISIPNHVISEQNVLDESSKLVEIKLDDKVFKEVEKINNNQPGEIYLSIIDGQHRVRGIEKTLEYLKKEIDTNSKMFRQTKDEKYSEDIKKLNEKMEQIAKIELPVTFFIDPVLEYQAMIFSTINRTQTKVPPNLVYSLFGLTKGDSPQKTVLNIVNTLNGRENSPFHKRIKLAGAGTNEAKEFYKSGNPVLSQATVIREILKLICKNNKEQDIARHKKRSYFKDNPDRGLPFRKYYARDDDSRIIQILFSFFKAVSKTIVDGNGTSYWEFQEQNVRKPRNILQTTVGFMALLNILKDALQTTLEDDNNKIETYSSLLNNANNQLNFSDNKRYPFSTKGKRILYLDLSIATWPPKDKSDSRLEELKKLLENN
ncbi:DGQHR domain-containing protein [Aquimarina algiphila]|uniref:DGQHR domain-containing protein n=1 Tax=Aquimarina algiphila TaxID=2047982 RepID=UPI002491CF5F|nr:DGQHR domain-containing protein [Aquimarina algiphila]